MRPPLNLKNRKFSRFFGLFHLDWIWGGLGFIRKKQKTIFFAHIYRTRTYDQVFSIPLPYDDPVSMVGGEKNALFTLPSHCLLKSYLPLHRPPPCLSSLPLRPYPGIKRWGREGVQRDKGPHYNLRQTFTCLWKPCLPVIESRPAKIKHLN